MELHTRLSGWRVASLLFLHSLLARLYRTICRDHLSSSPISQTLSPMGPPPRIVRPLDMSYLPWMDSHFSVEWEGPDHPLSSTLGFHPNVRQQERASFVNY